MRGKKFKCFFNKVKDYVKQSLYLKLVFGAVGSFLVAGAVFTGVFHICIGCGIFRQVHADYESARYNKIRQFQEVVNRAKREDNTDKTMEYMLEHLSGDVFVTDKDGKILYVNKDKLPYYYNAGTIDIDKVIQEEFFEKEKDEFTYYDLMELDNEYYYVIQTTHLKDVYTYSNEWIFLFSGIVSGLVFFLMVFFMVRKKIYYIRYIAKSVLEISKGDLNHQVDIYGVDELATVATSINQMEESLLNKIKAQEQQNQLHHELITNMSHDLKTPLTVILGYLDIVRNKQYQTEEQAEKYLNISYEKALSLQTMILNLFELVKSEHSQISLNCQPVNLSRLLKQYCLEYEHTVKEDGFTFDYSELEDKIEIDADIDKIKRVFDNVYDNALKYCKTGGTIKIFLRNENDTVLMGIGNTAQTMSQSDLSKIFDKFYRCDKARNSVIEGNGIGLSTVKQIVEAHDGKVWAEYQDGEFYLKIRLRKKGV